MTEMVAIAKCPRCEKQLPIVEFAPDQSKGSGRKSHCRNCDAAIHRERYAARCGGPGRPRTTPPASGVLIEQPAAVLTGPAAALLSLLLHSPNVRVVVEQLPGWARPHRVEIAAAVDAVHRAGSAWRPEEVAVERDTATPVSAEPSSSCTAAAAAVILDLSPRRVQELAKAGVLPGQRVGRVWLLDRQAVRQVAAARKAAA